eukprot:gnl/TRDRNA2_/TRDRNA2_168483_c0_seq6.p1 gnl/TRDRNA2_/TRDRNA2_168483_c0~~gnl/TRDRNA2_/TRDRNA2_168483_c0_seq6.p1  ORF type:complete len:800 (+),score=190.46 gnl/TRDRNA2_/TRDRNA2_168483_c0_seq6:627-3026(+)
MEQVDTIRARVQGKDPMEEAVERSTEQVDAISKNINDIHNMMDNERDRQDELDKEKKQKIMRDIRAKLKMLEKINESKQEDVGMNQEQDDTWRKQNADAVQKAKMEGVIEPDQRKAKRMEVLKELDNPRNESESMPMQVLKDKGIEDRITVEERERHNKLLKDMKLAEADIKVVQTPTRKIQEALPVRPLNSTVADSENQFVLYGSLASARDLLPIDVMYPWQMNASFSRSIKHRLLFYTQDGMSDDKFQLTKNGVQELTAKKKVDKTIWLDDISPSSMWDSGIHHFVTKGLADQLLSPAQKYYQYNKAILLFMAECRNGGYQYCAWVDPHVLVHKGKLPWIDAAIDVFNSSAKTAALIKPAELPTQMTSLRPVSGPGLFSRQHFVLQPSQLERVLPLEAYEYSVSSSNGQTVVPVNSTNADIEDAVNLLHNFDTSMRQLDSDSWVIQVPEDSNTLTELLTSAGCGSVDRGLFQLLVAVGRGEVVNNQGKVFRLHVARDVKTPRILDHKHWSEILSQRAGASCESASNISLHSVKPSVRTGMNETTGVTRIHMNVQKARPFSRRKHSKLSHQANRSRSIAFLGPFLEPADDLAYKDDESLFESDDLEEARDNDTTAALMEQGELPEASATSSAVDITSSSALDRAYQPLNATKLEKIIMDESALLEVSTAEEASSLMQSMARRTASELITAIGQTSQREKEVEAEVEKVLENVKENGWEAMAEKEAQMQKKKEAEAELEKEQELPSATLTAEQAQVLWPAQREKTMPLEVGEPYRPLLLVESSSARKRSLRGAATNKQV